MSKTTALHILKTARRRETELRLQFDDRLADLARELEDARLARCTEVGNLASEAAALELPDGVIGAALAFAADASQADAKPGDAALLAEIVARYGGRFPESAARSRRARPARRATAEAPAGAPSDHPDPAPRDGAREELAAAGATGAWHG
ncbi:hypothetical protein [Microvirga pudoricolor]|uniref:hypothetical protein n=1 Tax=Microvirga pudoricolor TaxID=2778729 RepID=UPI00194E1F06|nr:hypothetical protein [Microvirga pudoricolor]MBM6595349.1 hypothetical protein [Microvirga pudoricolor]